MAEISNHEPRLTSVCDNGVGLSQPGSFNGEEVNNRVNKLQSHWSNLKEKADKRKQDLDDALLVIISLILIDVTCTSFINYLFKFSRHINTLLMLMKRNLG